MLRLDINLVFTIINLLIWYAIIRIFLFKPINKVIDKRNTAIQEKYDEAKKMQEEAQAEKEKYAACQDEIEAEKNKEETKQEADEKSSYLIRKKTGEIIQLNKQTFIIGKLDTCCDYVIRGNNAISRLHAVIKYREDSDSYFIVDCNSTNHTYLNGRRIEAEQPVELKDGMHIHLALEEFIFQLT